MQLQSILPSYIHTHEKLQPKDEKIAALLPQIYWILCKTMQLSSRLTFADATQTLYIFIANISVATFCGSVCRSSCRTRIDGKIHLRIKLPMYISVYLFHIEITALAWANPINVSLTQWTTTCAIRHTFPLGHIRIARHVSFAERTSNVTVLFEGSIQMALSPCYIWMMQPMKCNLVADLYV